jgi:branched-chain amino acid transport system ATP-binding protein
MNLAEIRRTTKVIEKIRSQGTTILLVEHNMRLMDMCDQVVVVNFGRKIAQGSLEQVRSQPEVMQAYFGQGCDA